MRGIWMSRRASKLQKARLGYVPGTLAGFGKFWILNAGDLSASRELMGPRISRHGSEN
jgi:hypothetical protein